MQAGSAVQEGADPSSSNRALKLTVFSGFVSYDQLETKLLADNPKGPKWLHKSVDGPHAVRMRGPGELQGQIKAAYAIKVCKEAACPYSWTAIIEVMRCPACWWLIAG